MQRSGYTNVERAQCVLNLSRDIAQQIFGGCSKIHTEEARPLAPLHDSGAMTTKQEYRIIIEVDIDA